MKKQLVLNIFFILLIAGIFIILINIFWKTIENFESNIKMYVITLKHPDRISNIEKQEKKIDAKINIFDAVKGDLLDTNELYSSGEISDNYKNANKKDKRVIGCFLSHLKLLEKIKSDNKSGYTIIFEDDIKILSEDFMKQVDTIICNMDNTNFDLIFLGNLYSNKGEQLIDNIYKINKDEHLYGTHAYIVNNSNIDKILKHITIVDMPIDGKYEALAMENILDIFLINPTIVDQQGDDYLPSNINTLNIETFI